MHQAIPDSMHLPIQQHHPPRFGCIAPSGAAVQWEDVMHRTICSALLTVHINRKDRQ